MTMRCCGCMKLKEKAPYCEHCGWDERRQNEPHQLPVGTVLENKYVIGRVLGQGGFGITYIGWDTVLDIPIAIKEYFPTGLVMRDHTISAQVNTYADAAGDRFREGRERFLREAKALAKFFHIPQIVHIFNFFQANNTAYIIMEYVEGVTLRDHVRKNGVLSQDQTLSLLGPILVGLEQIHRGGIIHRDISPDNIMLLPNGSTKLLDFGAARDVSGAVPGEDASKSTTAILKQGYAPIEQYRGKGDMGPWTDVYALCATICFCLTGQTPPDAPERMMCLISGEDDGLHFDRIAPGNPQLQKALAHGMAHVAVNRTRSIMQMVEEMGMEDPEKARREREAKEKLEREQKEREARERAERERKAREAKERAQRERAEQERKIREAREKAERERKEREARERAERERKEREAREQAERERKEREAREKAERERREREAAERAERQRKERQAKEKAEQERKERQAKEKADRERKKQEAREQAERERKEREAKRKEAAALAASLPKPEKKSGKKWLLPAALICAMLVIGSIFLLPGDPQARDYENAVKLMKSGEYAEAMEILESLGDYEDSATHLERCRELLQEEQYHVALALLESGDYTGAADAFAALGGYRDSQAQAEIALKEKQYMDADALAAAGEHAKAGIAFGKLGHYRDAWERSFDQWSYTRKRSTVVQYHMGNTPYHTFFAAVKNDGTVHFYNGINAEKVKYAVQDWTDIVELYACYGPCLIGLRSDGTVVAVGHEARVPDVTKWENIVSLIDMGGYIFGLRADGTIAVTQTRNIGYAGTIVTDVPMPEELKEWTDIVTITGSPEKRIVGLKMDGTLVTWGENICGELDVSDWKDVVSIHMENQDLNTHKVKEKYRSLIGITADGAVLTSGNLYTPGIGEEMTDAVSMERNFLLRTDGTVTLYDREYKNIGWDVYPEYINPYDYEAELKAISGWNNVERICVAGDSAWVGRDIHNVFAFTKDGGMLVNNVQNNDVLNWKNVVDFCPVSSWDEYYRWGLRSDGTLLISMHQNVELTKWTDIRLP